MIGKFLKVSAILAFSMFALVLSGCSKQTDTPVTPKTPTPAPVPKRTERIEVMPSTSGEQFRRHIFDETGMEVETQIAYTNGDKGTVKLRPDGTREEYRLESKLGKLKLLHQYADDGTTVVAGRELRSDETLKVLIERAGNATKYTTYWFDGKREFSVEIRNPDGSWTATYYYKNGKVWMKKSGSAAGKPAIEESWTKNGELESRREWKNGNVESTRFRWDGTRKVTIVYEEKPTAWGGVQREMKYALEYSSDGSTVTRKIVLRNGVYYGGEVSETFNYHPDGTTTHRMMNSDGTIASEEVLDKDGKVTSTKMFGPDEMVRETIDRDVFWEPYRREPQQQWQLNEDYPYYRDQEDW